MEQKHSLLKRVVLPIAALAVLFGFTLTQSAEQTGAQVFRDNCTKCHMERGPVEKTDKEWRVVVTHMRTIALLTAKESDLVLEYLQGNNKD